MECAHPFGNNLAPKADRPMSQLKVYGDTNTLPENAMRDRPEERAALQTLRSDDRLQWFTSHIVRLEALDTSNQPRRDQLASEHHQRTPILRDERLLGFNTQSVNPALSQAPQCRTFRMKRSGPSVSSADLRKEMPNT